MERIEDSKLACREGEIEKFNLIKKNIVILKEKIKECKEKGITTPFDIEMTVLTELPEIYDDHHSLVKRLSKSEDDTILNKFLEQIEEVIKGNQSLASTELKLGLELKKQFVDPILEKNKNNINLN